MIESSNGHPLKKIRMMFSSNKVLMVLFLIFFFYGYIFFMKFRPVLQEQYDKYLVTERHANVALIIIFCEMVGLRLSSYWLVWAATYLNLKFFQLEY